jgi:hypothetical protein
MRLGKVQSRTQTALESSQKQYEEARCKLMEISFQLEESIRSQTATKGELCQWENMAEIFSKETEVANRNIAELSVICVSCARGLTDCSLFRLH